MKNIEKFLLTIDGFDACEDPYRYAYEFATRREALAGLIEHVRTELVGEEDDPSEDEAAILAASPDNEEDLLAKVQRYFDSFEPLCGPASCEIHHLRGTEAHVQARVAELSETPEYEEDEDEPEDRDGFYSRSDGLDDDLIDGVGFADPGGRSALRAATRSNPRNLPCPSCGTENVLTPADVAAGYQCNRCADAAEGRGY